MRLRDVWGITVALAAWSGGAHAQEQPGAPEEPESELPISYSQRPLTLPQLTLRADVSGAFTRYDLGGFGSLDFGVLAFGAGFGILDDLEIDAVIVPIVFNESFGFFGESGTEVHYGNPLLGLTYRFVDHEVVEVGASLAFSIPVDDDRFFGIYPGVPVRVHFDDFGRLDTGVYFSAYIPVSDQLNNGDAIGAWAGGALAPFPFPLVGDAGLPLRLTFNPIEYLFLGMRTGIGIFNFDEPANSFFIPVGFHLGGTVPLDDRPLVDIGWYFDLPVLFLPASDLSDKVVEDIWSTGGWVSFYIPLG